MCVCVCVCVCERVCVCVREDCSTALDQPLEGLCVHLNDAVTTEQGLCTERDVGGQQFRLSRQAVSAGGGGGHRLCNRFLTLRAVSDLGSRESDASTAVFTLVTRSRFLDVSVKKLNTDPNGGTLTLTSAQKTTVRHPK